MKAAATTAGHIRREERQNLTGLDIAIVLTALLAAGIGFWRGILRPIIGIAGFLAGLVLATAWYGPLSNALWPDAGTWASVVSYAIILLVVLILIGVIGGLVSRAVHETPFGIVDRILGLVAALLLILAAWVILLALVAALAPQGAETIAQSPIAALLLGFLPDVGETLSSAGMPV